MCGIIGIIGSPDASREAFLGLITLQHRGQDAAGILTSDQSFHLVKDLGLVENVFHSKDDIDSLTGSMAIAHTRYSTVGKGDISEVQPLVLNFPYGLGMVHNGNIVNYPQIKERLEKEMRRKCLTNSDTESLLNWFAHHLEGAEFADVERAVQSIFDNVIGSFSIAGILSDRGLFAFRDPNGIRPLVLGKKRNEDGSFAYMVASETTALTFTGYEFERDVQPGELLYITQDSEKSARQVFSKVLKPSKASRPLDHRPCMFEWVYFAGAESQLESTPIYRARHELGRHLVKRISEIVAKEGLKIDLVAPVPDTSRTAAVAISEELGVPYREVLIKNRYIKRTFILGSDQKRSKAVDLKLSPIISEIKGKNVLLTDDSIVRGTTSKKIIQLVRRAGAAKVYFVSTCPPIRYPCFYGIDFPDPKELVASERSEDEVAKEIGADRVIYQDLEDLVAALREASLSQAGKTMNPCTACLNGKYPTDISEAKRFTLLRSQERKGS